MNNLGITEREIRWAMENTSTVASAARFLGVGVQTFKKYACLYYEGGKTLYEIQREKPRIRSKRPAGNFKKIALGINVLVEPAKYRQYLFKNALIEEKCFQCGYSNKRLYDLTTPLLIKFRDGNKKNGSLENIEMICYNCYYIESIDFPHTYEKPRFILRKNI